ncbi:hypothetical protein FLAG1_11713 [Fusarium langsethiae]|uniref:Uncharacterized protein n=1 Tax=Fusarium langsethiae TaxID=179993 RepID=A0A0N0DAR3_FUSLA|nr:hypothetical protein FLAG1_11713 [Fusarium langsethiae]
MKSICIPQYCGLCRFKLEYGDYVISVRPITYIRSEIFSHSIAGFSSNTLSIEYVECRGRCSHDEQGYACHADCLKTFPHGLLPDALEVTKSAFEPPILTDKKRMYWYRTRLAGIINTSNRQCLPPEICDITAGWALDDRATHSRLAVDLIRKRCAKRTSFTSSITTSEKVYARHISFEGISYVACLTNAPDDDKDVPLLEPTLLTSIDSLHIASDHLGIRRLLFSSSSEKHTVEPEVGIWWKSVSLASLGDLIQFGGDGLKLRYLIDGSTALTGSSCDIPHSLCRNIRYENICNAERSDYLSVICCNDLRTTAYSLCWNSVITMVHAHRSVEGLDFYHALRILDNGALWLYMPLWQNELLTEIWRLEGPLRKTIGLLLVTNQGRSNFLGIQPRPSWDRSKWKLLDLPHKSRSCIYAEMSPHGIRALGFESVLDRRPAQMPKVDWPTSPHPTFRHDEFYAWNKASLNGVAEFTPCQRLYKGKVIMIGLLLRYVDGTSAGIGQGLI